MVKVNITVDASAYTKISEQLPEIKSRGLKYVGQEMLRNLSLNSPVDHGLLRQWFFFNTSADHIEIRSPAAYAIFVDQGTGIYGRGNVIRPKRGKALAFKAGPKWNGPVNKDGYAFLKYSKGQKGQKFVEKSIEQTQAKLDQLFIKAINEVIQ